MLGSFSGSVLRGSSDSSYGQIPMTFIANRGQVHQAVRFMAKGPGLTAYFTPSEVTLELHGATIRARYLGANVSPGVDGGDPQEGRANFLIGADPSKWRTNVPLYGRVVYRNLYPGIDMVYSSHTRLLKSEFVVAPDGDPSQIRIEYSGVESLRVDDRGGLVFTTQAGELREDAPMIYQENGAGRDVVNGGFRVSGATVSFFVDQYDRSRPLRIDPVLSYSTYLGGAGTDRAYAIAVDSAGAAYITGYTDSSNYPVSSGVVRPATGGGVDAFVTKLNAAGNAIVYSTYLGGSGDDRGYSIAVDSGGNAYVTGWTGSTDFPLAAALQSTIGGSRDAFVAKLNSTGSALIYSTYLGGVGTDSGNGIAIDAGGAAYVTGATTSTNFPVLGAFQAALAGQQDGFVTKLNAAGSAIVYSTYLGGALDDRGSSIAVDSAGAAYIAGNTNSTNFPTVSALQTSNSGSTDAFVAKLSASGASLVYSTYLGGSGTENIEVGRSIAVDSSLSAYVTGATSSTNFPVAQPLQMSNKGGYDAFVAKLSPAGTAFVYSTYLGGSTADYGQSIAVDSGGNAYLTGYTTSVDFPTANADQPVNAGNNDVFVSKINASGSAVIESGFLGGGDNDSGYGIAIDASGSAYVTGLTLSSNFPLKGAIQSTGGMSLAAFVAKFTFGPAGPPVAVSVTPSSGGGSGQTFSMLYSDIRGVADISWVDVNWNGTQSTVNACYLHYVRATNTLQLMNDAGSAWLGPVTPGVAGTLQNSQCVVDAGASTTTGAGNNLTVNLSLTFKPAFTGLKNTYMQVQDVSGTLAAWQALGSWTASGAAPSAVSVTPASGSGGSQTFAFVYTDPYGVADINYINMLFQSQLSGPNACWVQYLTASNTVYLVADSGSGFAGSGVLGVPGTLNNSQCTVDVGASSMTSSGNNLTFKAAITFKATFNGAKSSFMGVFNNAFATSGWQTKGVWTVSGNLPSTNVSVTPASGTGTTQTFTFVYSDPYGFADVSYVNMLFQTTISGLSSCWVQYVRSTNLLDLVNDSGAGYAGTGTPGVAGTLNNNQCTIDVGASSVSGAGNNLTVTVALTFKAAFNGAKNIYMSVANNSGGFSGWQSKGAWTASASLPPTNTSATPSSGSGSTQAFVFAYADPNGAADINYINMLFQTQIVGEGACWVQYLNATNTVYLVADSGSGYAGSAILGTAGTISNSQCTVNTGTSTLSAAGNNLTFTAAVTFKAAFSGAKNIYMSVFNNAGATSGWQAKGVWTTP